MKIKHSIEDIYEGRVQIPGVLKALLDNLTGDENYEDLAELQSAFAHFGWDLDYGLDSCITEIWKKSDLERYNKVSKKKWNGGHDMHRIISLRGSYEQWCAGSGYYYTHWEKRNCSKRLRKSTNKLNPVKNMYEYCLGSFGNKCSTAAAL